MTNKLYPAEIKVFGDEALGQVDFYASVFGNVDKYGDVMDAKAFDNTLANDFRAKNKRLPITFAHALGSGLGGSIPGSDPFGFIGYAEANDVVADSHGLRVKAQLDLDNPVAVQVHKLLKQGIIDQASFGFHVTDQKPQKDGSTLIKSVQLYEAALALVGVNGEAEVLAVKALNEIAKVSELETASDEQHDDEHRTDEELAVTRAKSQTDIAFAAARLRLMKAEVG